MLHENRDLASVVEITVPVMASDVLVLLALRVAKVEWTKAAHECERLNRGLGIAALYTQRAVNAHHEIRKRSKTTE